MASQIFCLPRILHKSVFTETTPECPGGRPRRVFCCTDATRPRAAYSFASRKRRQVMPFQKGECGNPAGRPRGARNRTTLLMESLLADDAEAIGRKAIAMAKQGDMAAIRLCMDRL